MRIILWAILILSSFQLHSQQPLPLWMLERPAGLDYVIGVDTILNDSTFIAKWIPTDSITSKPPIFTIGATMMDTSSLIPNQGDFFVNTLRDTLAIYSGTQWEIYPNYNTINHSGDNLWLTPGDTISVNNISFKGLRDTVTTFVSVVPGDFIYLSSIDAQWRIASNNQDTTLAWSMVIDTLSATSAIIQSTGKIYFPSHGYDVGVLYSLDATGTQRSDTLSVGEIDQWLFNVVDNNTLDLKIGALAEVYDTTIFLSGSGTVNYLPVWTGTYTQGDSPVRTNGSGIGIGNSPESGFDIQTDGIVRSDVRFQTGQASGGSPIYPTGNLFNMEIGGVNGYHEFDSNNPSVEDWRIGWIGTSDVNAFGLGAVGENPAISFRNSTNPYLMDLGRVNENLQVKIFNTSDGALTTPLILHNNGDVANTAARILLNTSTFSNPNANANVASIDLIRSINGDGLDPEVTGDESAGNIVFRTNNKTTSTLSEWVRIMHDGKVGFTTPTPATTVDINGELTVRTTNQDDTIDSVAVVDGTGKVHFRDAGTIYGDLNPQTEVSSDTTLSSLWITQAVDVSSGPVEIDLPAGTPVQGDRFWIVDSRASSASNAITIDFISAGDNLYGASSNASIEDNGAFVEFYYYNVTIGWVQRH